ncbi:MAG: class I SAM-dependent methyltransferase [Thermoplasmatota archaeon]
MRRQLIQAGRLRNDLKVAKDADGIWFPTTDGDVSHDFEQQTVRARHYTDLLDWPAERLALCPRAFDSLGELVIVKVPHDLWGDRADLGEAMRQFTGARAVFHDRGVTGAYRTRDLERIAGEGGSATTVQENGATLHVDPAAAYYSPRLADERRRLATLTRPGEHVIDLFGGVAPQGIQLAKQGAHVISVDLNPAAIELAHQNAATNKVNVELHCGDARELAKTLDPADRVIMNLPHGAKDFLAEGAGLTRAGGVLHHHEILAVADLESRTKELEAIGHVEHVRHVRAYSAQEAHYVFDLRVL